LKGRESNAFEDQTVEPGKRGMEKYSRKIQVEKLEELVRSFDGLRDLRIRGVQLDDWN
jgi:hypothetical protein